MSEGAMDGGGDEERAWALLSDALPADAPPAEQRARLLDALHGRERFVPFAREVAQIFGLVEAQTLDALRAFARGEGLREGFFPGSFVLPVSTRGGALRVLLSKLAPGTRIEQHTHQARELTYVLSGELVEDGARVYGPGELMDGAPGTHHVVQVGDDEPCWVVFAEERAAR